MSQSNSDLTRLLQAWSQGDPEAMNRLAPLIIGDLRRMARRHLRGEAADCSLESRDLLQQVYIRLMGQRHIDWQNREHFFAIAARIMRWVLTDHGKAQGTLKRKAIERPLEEAFGVAQDPGIDHSALYEALDRHAVVDPRQAEIVGLYYFFGLKHEEIAKELGISETTSKRQLRVGKAWLRRELIRKKS